jgi:ribosomal protein S2
MIDLQRAVKQFVSDTQNLYRKLRIHGEQLSDLDLMTLREQLHILDTEAGHLQDLKSDGVTFMFHGRKPQTAKASVRKVA